MKRGQYLIGLCLAVGLATAGCSGSSNNGNGVTNSAFQGSYVGTFAYNGGAPTGVFAVYISPNGNISGRGVNIPTPTAPSTDSAQTLSGSVDGNAQITLTSNGTAGSTTYGGDLGLTSSTLTATIDEIGGVAQSLTINTPSIPTSNVFAGSYSGNFTSSNINNSLTLIVNAAGTVTGLDINTTASPNTYTTVAGSITPSSGTSTPITLTTTTNGSTVGTSTGTVTLSGATATISLTGASGLPTSLTLTQDTKQQ